VVFVGKENKACVFVKNARLLWVPRGLVLIYIYIYILVNSKNGYIGLIYKGKILTKHYYTI
jgi:hypothetical protein